MVILEVLALGMIYIALREIYLEVRLRMKVVANCKRFMAIQDKAAQQGRIAPQLRALLDDIKDRIENRGEVDSERVEILLRSAEKVVGL